MRCSSVYRGTLDEAAVAPRAPRPDRAVFSGAAAFSVTIHDVAPATQAHCERLMADLCRASPARFTLLVVPRYRHESTTPSFERWIGARLRAGDELALHGFTHRDDAPVRGGLIERLRRQVYTAGEGEFAALGDDEASARLEAGRDWFTRRGWPLRGFIAPAWLLGAGAWRALARQPFDYTCTLRHLLRRADGEASGWRALETWSIVYSTRAAWRRQASLAWNGALVWHQRRTPWMRFELHPADFRFASIRAATLHAIRRAMEGGRVPLTLGAAADRLAPA